VFRGAPSWARHYQEFHRVPGKMQDSLRVPGKTLHPRELPSVQPRRSRSIPVGTSSRGPKPLCTFKLLLSRREPVLPARTHPISKAFPFMVLIWKPTSEMFWGLGSPPSVQSTSAKPSEHDAKTRRWTSSRTLDAGTQSIGDLPDYRLPTLFKFGNY
jgi:hypothetical protein